MVTKTTVRQPGVAVDAQGGGVIDPTANVIALVEANAQAAAALRVADIKFNDSQHAHLKEIGLLRAKHAEALTLAESKRIDAIRAVDVGAVATAAERTAQQAVVLANQVGTSAETLRTLVASTAASMAQSATQFSAQVTERLALLERSQYKGEGRSGLAEPQMAELLSRMEKIGTAQATGSGKTAGISAAWVVVLGGIAALGTLFGIGAILVAVVVYLTKGVS